MSFSEWGSGTPLALSNRLGPSACPCSGSTLGFTVGGEGASKLKASLYFHFSDKLRVAGGIKSPSGAPAEVRVERFEEGTGRCRVMLRASETEHWDETWELVKAHSPTRATFSRPDEHGGERIEVTLES
ncbi:MAG: hypothetical protein RL685_3424 [Pseudomonadota bacterium]